MPAFWLMIYSLANGCPQIIVSLSREVQFRHNLNRSDETPQHKTD